MQSSEIQKKVGQLFAVGFHGLVPSLEIRTLIREYAVGAIVLFKRNIRDAAQLQSLTLALQQEAKDAGHEHPLLIGIDQENGLVTRISPPVTAQLPGPMTLGATRSPELAYDVGKATGEALRFFGINMNYAPVGDVNSEPLNPVIGVRSPGDDPEFVGRFASSTAQGLRDCKVVPSVKHFPGHGDTAVDSHYGLPAIGKNRDQLERCELIPFRRCVAEGVETVMTAHIALSAIGDGKLPATLSADSLNILRNDMKYDGMVVSDCLEMDGVRATYGTEQGSVLALKAGCDSLMICHTYDIQVASIKKVCEAVQSGLISTSRLEKAYGRVGTVKRAFLDWDTALRQGSPDALISLNKNNEFLAKEVYSHSATLVRSEAGVLPLSKSCRIALLLPGGEIPAGGAVDGEGMGRKGSYKATYYTDILQSHNQTVDEIRYGTTATTTTTTTTTASSGLSAEQWKIVAAADVVILISINARESPYQRSLGLELPRRCSQKVIAIAACSPYDFLEDSDIETYICTYEPTVEAFAAAADILFGVTTATGALPVAPNAALRASTTTTAVAPFDLEKDLDELSAIWQRALPTYAIPKENLEKPLARSNGHHFVARIGSTIAGFCIAFATETPDYTIGHIAVVAVDPSHQNQGVGTALLTETRSYFRKHFNLNNLILGSIYPRFWPGVPDELPEKVQQFFVHRGFRLSLPDTTAVDLYQDIRNFQAPEKYVARAKEQGYTFGPLQPEHYEECIAAQKKNFSAYVSWPQAYQFLHPNQHPSSIMTAFDPQGHQVAWTLMLSPTSLLIRHGFAFPPLCGPQTGLIGCVGVDAAYRKHGIGLALLCHAIEDMKQRGVEGVFVDWVNLGLEGWYGKLGFGAWRRYGSGEI